VRLDRALELVHSPEARRLPRDAQIELRIVESGIRRDQGLADAAVLVLQVPELNDGSHHQWSARLFYAYAEALLAAGRAEAARQAFGKAIEADPEGETDAIDRLDEVDGVTVSDLASDDDDDDFDHEDDDEDLDGESDDELNDEDEDDDESDDDDDEDLDGESDDELNDEDEEGEDDLDDELGDDEESDDDDDLDGEALAAEDDQDENHLSGELKHSSAKDEPPSKA
jgi:hypothetical protein